MSQTTQYFVAILLWSDPNKGTGCVSALDGSTYIFRYACLQDNYRPQPSDIISFTITFHEHSLSARNNYTIDSISLADLEAVHDSDLETLNRCYVAHQDKDITKRRHRDEQISGDRFSSAGIIPLKDRWAN